MSDFLNIYDLTRKKTAVLQNAFSITETQELNKIYTLDFSFPSTDEKVKYIQPFHYVRWGENGQLYRVIKTEMKEDSTGILNISCEHAITTLCDNIMFGAQQYGGGTIKTANVITWLLNKQTTKNWTLGTCDFDRKFEYLWEQENILNALYSIPKEFSKAYKWIFDTSSYPWKISLKTIDETVHPEYYIRAKKNLLGSGSSQDFADICTRIYPLGYGEGVNQLNISDATVTGVQYDANRKAINATPSDTSTVKYGNTYIQSPASITNVYGIKEKVLVDRRYENANSLFSYAKTMLESLQVPSMSRSFDVVDLYPITSENIDNAEVGKICKMTGDDTTAYITKTVRVLDDPGNLSIELSTKATDVASTIADLADRVRIESVYAQGATQLYQHSKDANATPTKGMVMSLYFPSEMKQINKVLMRLRLGRFRSYSKASSGENGAINTNTGENGAIDTNTGENGAINTNTGENGAIDTNTGENGAIDTNTDLGGDINTNTQYGGAVDTTTGGGGGQSGTTGIASGGGNISLDGLDLDISVNNTEDTVWSRTPYTWNTDLNIKVAQNGGQHQHYVYGRVANTEPLESVNYRHSHRFDESGINLAYTGGDEGGHTHDAYVDNGEDDGHHHDIPVSSLKHYHTVTASGNVSVKNNEGGGQTGFSHTHDFKIDEHNHTIRIDGHTHSIQVGGHSHSIKIGGHKHSIKIGGHKHSIKIGGHKHSIKVNPHSHSIEAGIFESGSPTAFDIYVNGTKKVTQNGTSFDGDITEWLLGTDRQIQRGTWIDVEIRPNDLAYVQSSVFVQGFVQSRGGGNY